MRAARANMNELFPIIRRVRRPLLVAESVPDGPSKRAGPNRLVRQALTHNLLLLYEARLEAEHGVSKTAEDHRRQQRRQAAARLARQAGRLISSLRAGVQRATQRSVKFLRWLRYALRENLTEATAVPRLAHSYATS